MAPIERPLVTERFEDRIPEKDYDKVVAHDSRLMAEQRSVSRQLYHLTVWSELATERINEIEKFLAKNNKTLGELHPGESHNPLHPPADWPPN